MSDNKDLIKKLNELIDLSQSIRNLLILQISTADIPHEKIAKAAHIQKQKIYDFIPKKKKGKGKKQESVKSNG